MADFNNINDGAGASKDLENWYHQFNKIGDDVANIDVPKDAKGVLGSLLLYAVQLKSYSDFISSYAMSIDNDIRMDTIKDTQIEQTGTIGAPIVPEIKPLAFALKNKENAVKVVGEIDKLVKAIDGILSRVKDSK